MTAGVDGPKTDEAVRTLRNFGTLGQIEWAGFVKWSLTFGPFVLPLAFIAGAYAQYADPTFVPNAMNFLFSAKNG